MIEGALDCRRSASWRALESELRRFVERRIASSADVDDVIQDVLTRILTGLPRLRDEERFGPWVYRIARHAIADHHRASSRHSLASEPREHSKVEGVVGEEDHDAVAREVSVYAALFVTTLPSPYREALTLTELEGRTQKEAAEMLGISVSGMKSRVQRGRRKLREALEACCHIGLDARRRIVSCKPRFSGVA